MLCADGVPLHEVARELGTPTYVYARSTLRRHVRVLHDSLADLPHRICYAVKANGNLSVLATLAQEGCDFDAVSVGELLRVRQAGADVSRTIFSGVGKTDQEIAQALQLGVLYLSAESLEEVAAIARIASELGVVAPLSVRVNPEVDAKTHPYISTGMAENKFGLPQASVPQLCALARQHASLSLRGVSCHIGSQITTLDVFADAAKVLREVVTGVMAQGHAVDYVGMGGGLGIPYTDERPPAPAAYGACLRDVLAPLGKTLVLEPGRVLVGNAGVLLARVVRIKDHGARRFVVLDAGMNDLLRPALYQAKHAIEAVAVRAGEAAPIDVVGPVCESADTFARGALLPPLQVGDLVAIRSAGAYGFAMASTYNGRPKAAEVLCDEGRFHLVGRRERLDELWRLEALI